MDTEQVLIERRKTHGDFLVHSMISQSLKECLWVRDGWRRLNLMQQEALEMICTKIARIIAGDPNFSDHYRDICGYSMLVLEYLEGKESGK